MARALAPLTSISISAELDFIRKLVFAVPAFGPLDTGPVELQKARLRDPTSTARS